MQITIDLTDEQVKFLKMFSANHYPESKQNLATSYPIHFVQTRRERVVDSEYDSPDKTVYVVPDWSEDYEDEKDYFEAYGIDDKTYYKVDVEYYYETVAVFFILEEAKRYMEYQGHNLVHPRTYTYGPGYANKGDYTHFWSLLFDMGSILNKEQ